MSESNATADVPWDGYINMYISFSVGRLRCSFRHPGNAKALHSGASDEASAPRSFYVCANLKLKPLLKVAKRNKTLIFVGNEQRPPLYKIYNHHLGRK